MKSMANADAAFEKEKERKKKKEKEKEKEGGESATEWTQEQQSSLERAL